MPPPKSPSSYPPAFQAAVDRAFSQGEFEIPCVNSNPTTLRLQMYGFLKTLRANGQTELADSVYIQDLPGKTGIKLINRNSAPVVLDITKALGEELPGDDSDGFFDRVS